QKGVPVKKALPKSEVKEFLQTFGEGLYDAVFSDRKSKKDAEDKEKNEPKPVDQVAVQNIQNKIASPLCEVNIRCIASANTEQEALQIINDIESSFNQF